MRRRPIRPEQTADAGDLSSTGMMIRSAMLGALVGLGACAGQPRQEVVPTSHLAGGGGPPIAAYTLRVNGEKVGDVDVRSGGAFRAKWNGGKSDFLHVELSVDNDWNQPLRVPVPQIQVSGLTTQPLVPVGINGGLAAAEIDVPPQTSRTLDAVFQLPAGLRTTDVQDFQLDWVVWAGNQAIRHGTSFAAVQPPEPIPVYDVGPYAPFVVGPLSPFSPFCGPFYCYGYY